MRRKLAAGNWKMNGLPEDRDQIRMLAETHANSDLDILICPPATILHQMSHVAGMVALGGQDCHANASGAHTGDISAEMLKSAGATYVIVGHSERRTDHAETDEQVCEKASAAQRAGLVAVVCIGETLAERESGQTLDVIKTQLEGSIPAGAAGKNCVIAYEPVWAIGTGKVPTLEQIGEVHGFIRAELTTRFGSEGHDFRILYGGSVKPGNAAEIFGVADVDGALVGGASLKFEDFSPIINALEAS